MREEARVERRSARAEAARELVDGEMAHGNEVRGTPARSDTTLSFCGALRGCQSRRPSRGGRPAFAPSRLVSALLYDPASVAPDLCGRPIHPEGVRMAGGDPRDERALLVVARGQNTLLETLREFFAEFGWVDVIEDRRQGPSLLPRARDREDTPSFA